MTTDRELPLSPHLQIYKAQMTSAMSIFHRMTGAFLAVGTLAVIWMLLAAASGPGHYAVFASVMNIMLVKVVLTAWAGSLFYHMFNGIRHLFWDAGYLFDLKNAFAAGYVVLALTAISTGLFCWKVFF